MTSKRNEREQLRRARKEKRSRAPELSRANAGWQDIYKRILIVGEGVNTEPSYFDKFRVPGVKVMAKGLGEGTRKLVNDVESVRADEERKQGVPFDEIWVAFDKDSFKDFEQAIREAGYEISLFGERDIRVDAVPFILGKAELHTMLPEMLDELYNLRGAQLDIPIANELVEQGLGVGLVLNHIGDSILRFLPPLVVSYEQIDVMSARLSALIDRLAG